MSNVLLNLRDVDRRSQYSAPPKPSAKRFTFYSLVADNSV